MEALLRTDLPLPNRREGKVRDVYDLPDDGRRPPALAIVATDRLSAFDVVLPTPLPGKGKLLTQISAKWFRFVESRHLAKTHVLSTDAATIPGLSDEQRRSIEGRVMVGRRCRVVPVECVARGYLAGSSVKEYEQTGEVCGVTLPKGLRSGDSLLDRLGEPIFTPATKAERGAHDENISFERACEVAGVEVMTRLRDLTLSIYAAAHDYALARGLILADTKFEFGLPVDERGEVVDDEPILVDEALTPDSSRYWPADDWAPGLVQPSFDKQFVREHLERLVERGLWNKQAPGPELPEDVVRETLAKYEEAERRLFGEDDDA